MAGVEQIEGAVNVHDLGAGRGHLAFAELQRRTFLCRLRARSVFERVVGKGRGVRPASSGVR